MKALPKKLLALTLFGIVVTSLFSIRPAQAYLVTLEQIGSNVVATGNGIFNLTGLSLGETGVTTSAVMAAVGGEILSGPAGLNNSGPLDVYAGFTGPFCFGMGSGLFPQYWQRKLCRN